MNAVASLHGHSYFSLLRGVVKAALAASKNPAGVYTEIDVDPQSLL